MRTSFFFLFLVSAVPSFAQDDFYARQLENRQFEERQFAQQLETRRLEAQRVEAQRVEQARVRKVQDREDQEASDARFAQQQRELNGARGTPLRLTTTPGVAKRANAARCVELRVTGLNSEEHNVGVRGEGDRRIVQSAFKGELNGQPIRLIAFTTLDEWSNTARVMVIIHPQTPGPASLISTSMRVDQNEYHGSKKKGSWRLRVRDVVFGRAGCASLPRLDIKANWSSE